jgi:hypothetical protein
VILTNEKTCEKVCSSGSIQRDKMTFTYEKE